MATHTTRQTASMLLTSSRCLRRQNPSSAARLLASGARRCMHQEQEQRPTTQTGGSLSYRPLKRMNRAPFPIERNMPFVVNEDEEKLDAMYHALLGGNPGLSEEVKWQAVTHKSFDHGWDPYNEKLAFYGKLVLRMHTSLHHLVNRPEMLGPRKTHETPARESADAPILKPFNHPDYHYLTFVNRKNVSETLSSGKIGRLARMVGLPGVMRWKPAYTDDLVRSGQGEVAAECLYAIIGAVALRRGGAVAERLVRGRILSVLNSLSRAG